MGESRKIPDPRWCNRKPVADRRATQTRVRPLVIDVETQRFRRGIEIGTVNEQREFFFVWGHEVNHLRDVAHNCVNSARDRGYLEGRASENARPQGSRALSLQWIGTIRAYGHHGLLTLQ